MKILLDENCRSLRPYLVEMGWEAIAVKDVLEKLEGGNGVSDDQVLNHALKKKMIIITKDNGLKKRCDIFSVPYIDLGSPEQEAKVVHKKLNEMLAWKDYF